MHNEIVKHNKTIQYRIKEKKYNENAPHTMKQQYIIMKSNKIYKETETTLLFHYILCCCLIIYSFAFITHCVDVSLFILLQLHCINYYCFSIYCVAVSIYIVIFTMYILLFNYILLQFHYILCCSFIIYCFAIHYLLCTCFNLYLFAVSLYNGTATKYRVRQIKCIHNLTKENYVVS